MIATIAISVCAILAFKVREVAPARGRGARVRECALPPLFPRAHTRAHKMPRLHAWGALRVRSRARLHDAHVDTHKYPQA